MGEGDTERPTQPEQPRQPTKVARREFLKKAGLAAAGVAVGGIALGKARQRKEEQRKQPSPKEVTVVDPEDGSYRSIDLQSEEDRRKFERTHKIPEHFKGWSRSGWSLFRFGAETARGRFEETGSSRIVKAGTEISFSQDRVDAWKGPGGELNPNTEIRIDEYVTSDGRRVPIFKVTGLREEWYRERILDPPQDRGSDMAVVVFQNTFETDATLYFGIKRAQTEYPAFELVEVKPRE